MKERHLLGHNHPTTYLNITSSRSDDYATRWTNHHNSFASSIAFFSEKQILRIFYRAAGLAICATNDDVLRSSASQVYLRKKTNSAQSVPLDFCACECRKER